MKKIAIIGASGYAGAQLVSLVDADPSLEIFGTYVSLNSEDKYKALDELFPVYNLSYILEPLCDEEKQKIAKKCDAVALATEHNVSLELAAYFYNAGLHVFDLSGAYRLSDSKVYPRWYGFEHNQTSLLELAVYGLAEWESESISNSRLIAVPGCYPTASILALKPLVSIIDGIPIINATSGVTGAGRKPKVNTSFAEVSLTPYGVLGHRHQPEIEEQLGINVVFTPHLANFKRGILATITAKLKEGVTELDIINAYLVYQNANFIKVKHNIFPKIDDVANTPYCHVGWKYDQDSGYIVIGSCIDNLMKGAASQALQCILLNLNGDK